MNNVILDPKQIFLGALTQDSPEKLQSYLDEACDGNSEVRARVEALLRAHGEVGKFLGGPPSEMATIDPTGREVAGTLVGPYKLLEQIGEGGMGLVYMAEQQRPVRRLVALKLVKPGMDTKQVIARFEAERQALAMMDHPNIAKVLDAGTIPLRIADCGLQIEDKDSAANPKSEIRNPKLSGRPYFVMELVRGIPINEFCDQQKLAVRQRLELFIQVCQAVQHAHQKGIIHRDLKPTNVLVTHADTVPLPKVIDFGIAKALGPALTDHTLHTGFAQLVGTPMYMSPEQAQMNHFGVDTRSDVYSLGVLLYELLTGTTPFDKERLKNAGFDEMRRIIREEEPETVSQRLARTRAGLRNSEFGLRIAGTNLQSAIRNPQLAELDWIVMKALEKDRSRRYESASALAADIQRYLSDEPVLACPPTTMYRFQKFSRKHKPALVTATAIAACLVLGTTVSAWQAVRATTAEAQANANEQKAVANEHKAVANEQKAIASERKAVANAAAAEEKEQEAIRQRDEVKALNDRLAAKEQQLQRTLYAAHINLAHNAWNVGSIRRVGELLEQHRPKPNETDLRHFEWRYLYRLCHPELLTLKGKNAVFSPDGKRLAFSFSMQDQPKRSAGGAEVKICDALTGQELVSCKGHTSGLVSIAFSPDGNRLASAGGGELKVWDAKTGNVIFDLKGHTGALECVSFSPDGKRFASGSSVWRPEANPDQVPSEIRIWDAATGDELIVFKGHSSSVYCLAFSFDAERVASGSYDGTVKVWSIKDRQQVLSFKAHDYQVASVGFCPDGNRLVSGGAFGAKVWNAQTGQELVSLKGVTGQINGLAVSPDGKRVAATMGFDPAVRVWDAATGEELASFKGHTGAGGSVAFSPDGTRLASANNDGTIRVWDVSTSQEALGFSGPTGPVRNVGFSRDGKRLAGTAMDPTTREGALKVWDAKTGQELLSIKMPTGASPLHVAKISPDGTRLAAGFGTWHASDKTKLSGEVKVWDAQTGRELVTFKGHTVPVVSLAFSPDSARIVSSSSKPLGISNSDPGEPGEVKVWDAQSGAELLTLKGHKRFVGSVAYSADGKHLATLSRDQTLKIWDAQTGRELLSLPAQVSDRGILVFSPDGKRIASSSKPLNTTGPVTAGDIKLWNIESGEELFLLQGHSGWVTTLAFSPDGKRLASSWGLGGRGGGGGGVAGGSGGAGVGRGGGGAGGGRFREVKLWDVETGEELLTFETGGGGGVAFSPDGHRLVTSGAEGLKIFDATPLPEKP